MFIRLYVVRKISCIFVACFKIETIMAMEIKSPPVLEGQAARDFYKRWAKCTERKSKEEVQESMRTTKIFLDKYYNPYI